jgi:hypothetical protein
MKISLQYLRNSDGELTAVQLPLSEWEKIVAKLKKLEQSLKIKTEIKEAIGEVETLRKSIDKQQSLNGFLNDL